MDNLNEIFSLNQNATSESFPKGTILQHQGDFPVSSYFVKKGLLKSYTIDEKGKEHIFMFGPEGWIVADIESQIFEKPAALFIECLEDSDVIVFHEDLTNTSDLSKKHLLKQIQLMLRRIGTLQRRLIMMMSAPAIQRYEYFINIYPNLPNRIPQKMIAAYLGITPEALSSRRSKRLRSK